MSAGSVAVVDSWAHPLSYADAFAVAAGREEKAPVITGDPEILALPATVVRVRRLDRHA